MGYGGNMSKIQRTNRKKRMKKARLKMMKAVASKNQFTTPNEEPNRGPRLPQIFPKWNP